MIIRVHNKVFCVIVPQKCGISSVTNILGYPITGEIISKSRTRRILKKKNHLYHIGNTLDIELSFAKENDISIDYLYAVVRDPLDRFISAYKDRILKKDTDGFGDKSLSFAIENLPTLISSETDFGLHARPQSHWLGNSIAIYDKVFDTRDLNKTFKPLVEKAANVSIPQMRENVSDDAINIELTPEQKKYLQTFYSSDYALLEQVRSEGLYDEYR